jgi:integrase
MGRLVSGETIEAAVSECWQSRGELECPEISQAGIRRDGFIGYHFRRGRELSAGSASIATQNTTKLGVKLGNVIKPATAHKELRVLTHILNVAVKQKRLVTNSCVAVEFPVSVKRSTRKPHYMTASEQQKIEFAAPSYLRNLVIIVSELGLRYKKELLPMKKEQVDLENRLVHIADSKTATGIGDMPLTNAARLCVPA